MGGKKWRKNLFSCHTHPFPFFNLHHPETTYGWALKHSTRVYTSFRPQVSPSQIFPSCFNVGGGQGGNRKALDKYSQPSSDKQPYNNKPEQLNNALCLNRVPLAPPTFFFFFFFLRERDISQVCDVTICKGAQVYIKKTSQCHRSTNSLRGNRGGSSEGSGFRAWQIHLQKQVVSSDEEKKMLCLLFSTPQNKELVIPWGHLVPQHQETENTRIANFFLAPSTLVPTHSG